MLLLPSIVLLGCTTTPSPPGDDPQPLLGPRADMLPPGAPSSPSPASPPPASPPPARPAPRAAALKLPAVQVTPPGRSAVWVDATEATVAEFQSCVRAGACKAEQVHVQPDSPCNYDNPDRAQHPVNCVDWNGADAYCRWTNGRLCKEEEWFPACKGPSGNDYPYGPTWDAGACRAGGQEVPVNQRGTAEVASLPGCQGGYPGLHDMVGNVSEWLDACNDDYCHFYGGAFLNNDPVPDFASCKRLCAGNKKSFRSATIGFRCCHDSQPAR